MKKKILKFIFLFLFLTGLITLSIHNVRKTITPQDMEVILQITDSLAIDKTKLNEDYAYQIQTIDAVQKLVLNLIEPSATGIPLGEEREPVDVVEFQEGQCFDRSRLLEKVFIFYGLKIRHLSIYYHPEYKSLLKILMSRNVYSHAATEVKTMKGWLIIDSNSAWNSLSISDNPIAYKKLHGQKLKQEPVKILKPYYLENGKVIYGLYSRHGQFYPPFNRIPDFNIRELFYNFGC
jgi:hypothetical protein